MQLQIDRIAKRERVVSEFPGRNQLGRRSLRGALLGGTALAMALFGASAAQADCILVANLGNLVGVNNPTQVLAIANFSSSLMNSIANSITTLNTAFLTQNSAFIGSPPNPRPDQPGAGIWTRGVGGRADVDSKVDTSFTFGPGTGPPSTAACNKSTRNDFAGFQAGHDLARLNWGNGGWNAHFGVTAGYSETENRTGSVEARFQVPFVGLYGAITHRSGFFADAQIRGDFYHMHLSDPNNSLINQRLDARGYGATASTGYNFTFGSAVIQPSVGVVYARAAIDTLHAVSSIPAFTALGNPLQLATPFAATVNDVETLLGRIGVLVGTSFTAATFTFQPFVVANFWHEFAGPVTANATSLCSPGGVIAGSSTCLTSVAGIGPTTNESALALTASRLGSFGQISFGASAQITDTGWLGYGRVDFRKGDNIESVTVNGGVRYQFSPPGLRTVTARN